MRSIYFFILLSVGLVSGLKAQVNVATARANPKTFIFDDEKHTVHGYIYSVLKEQTNCCSNDAVYLEVKFDEGGYVTSTKTLTGKNDCYRKSIEDIVKNIRWDATGVKGTKTIYFDLKPIIPCTGGSSENVYKPIAVTNNPNFGGVASSNGGNNNATTTTTTTTTNNTNNNSVTTNVTTNNTGNNTNVTTSTNVSDPFANGGDDESSSSGDDVATTTTVTTNNNSVAVNTNTQSNNPKTTTTTTTTTSNNNASDEGFLSENTNVSNTKSNTTPVKTTTTPTKTTSTASTRTSGGGTKIPPQATDITYESKGDRKPQVETHENLTPQTVGKPNFQGDESQMAIDIKTELRKTGYCGLAQAAIEVTVSPSGSIVGSRVIFANDPKIEGVIPTVSRNFKFASKPIRHNYVSIVQFKTDILCNGKGSGVNLDEVPDVIKRVD